MLWWTEHPSMCFPAYSLKHWDRFQHPWNPMQDKPFEKWMDGQYICCIFMQTTTHPSCCCIHTSIKTATKLLIYIVSALCEFKWSYCNCHAASAYLALHFLYCKRVTRHSQIQNNSFVCTYNILQCSAAAKMHVAKW